MRKDATRWIDAPEFHWNPEQPLRFEPIADLEILPRIIPADEISEPIFLSGEIGLCAATEFVDIQPAANDDPAPHQAQARRNAQDTMVPPGHPGLWPRHNIVGKLGIGLAQGVFLLVLLQSRALGLPPGADPYWFASLSLVAIFAPLLLLQGLGRIPRAPLIAWTGAAGVILAAVGFYHRWRTAVPDPGHAGLGVVALMAVFLFVTQALLTASARDGKFRARYESYFQSAWSLGIQILSCALFAAICWGLLSAASGLLRADYPRLHLEMLEIPLLAMAGALAFCLATQTFVEKAQRVVLLLLTLSLPLLVGAGLAVCFGEALGLLPLSSSASGATAFALLLAINASYRAGPRLVRPGWRKIAEFTGVMLLGPLAALAAIALAIRVGQYGWTDMRILAAAALVMLGGYAISYAVAALIALGGGGWLQRIEACNFLLALQLLAMIAALVSPFADPVRLAVASQTVRAEKGVVPPGAIDFDWLRYGGLRFGRASLESMVVAKDAPALARGAFLALAEIPDQNRPTPTEIGANIAVRPSRSSGEAQLPASLLARDWSKVTTQAVPPCLTTAALGCDAYFVDLDGDGHDEIVLVYGNDSAWWAGVMKQGAPTKDNEGGWVVAGTLHAPACAGTLTALRAGQYQAAAPLPGWRDLLVGGFRLGVTPNGISPLMRPGPNSPACPAP